MASKPSHEGKTIARAKHCPNHTDKPVKLACLTCKVLACETCSKQHSGHDIKPCEGDGKLVQAICRAQTQEFYDILSILENQRDIKEERAKALQKAKSVVNDKIQRVIAKAREIQKRVDSQLDKAYEVARSEENRECDNIQKVDERIVKLTGVRNLKDVDVLIPEAVDSSVLLEEFANLKNSDRDIPIPGLGDILPGIDKLDAVLDDMDNVFDVRIHEVSDSFDYGSVGTLESIKIPDKTVDKHRICDAGPEVAHDVSIYNDISEDMRTYNLKQGTFERKVCSCLPWSCAKVSKDTYVATDLSGVMYILDDNLIRLSKKMEIYCNQDLCYHSQNRVVALHRDGSSPYNVTLRRISISAGKFDVEHEIKVSVVNRPFLICANPDKNVISMVSDSDLYIVNMLTGEVKTHDISKHLDEVYSIYVDNNDNTLVGDNKGRIHRFDRNMEHSIVAKVNGTGVWGVTIRGGKLIATASGKLWKQK